MSYNAPYTGAERRRYVRRPVRLDAEIDLNGGERLPVRILDFCEGGLFLGRTDGSVGRLALEGREIAAGTPMWVSFQIVVGTASRTFRVPVEVMRMIDSGLGVRFDPPQPTALAALQALAVVSDVPADAGRPDAPEILDGLHDNLSGWLKQTLRGLFKAAVDDLFVKARDATSNELQSECMDAMKDVERVSEKVATDCRLSVLGALDRLGPGDRPRREESGSGELGMDTSSLTLVDTGSFDDWVTAKNIMNRAEPKLRDDIYALSRRLSELCGREIDDFTNPAGIQQLGMAFNESMQNLGLPKQARKSIYKGFDEILVGSLPELYQQLNDFLVDEGVNPSLDRPRAASKPPRRAPTPPSAASTPAEPPAEGFPDAADAGDATAATEPPAAGADWSAYHAGAQGFEVPQAVPASGAPAVPTGAPSVSTAAPAGPAPMAGAAVPGAPAPVAAPSSMASPALGAPLSYAGGLRAPAPVAPATQVPMQEAYSAARNLMGLRQAMSSGAGMAGVDMHAAPTYAPPTPQLTSALSRLGRSADFNQPTDGRPMHLGERLMASLERDGIELSDSQREMMNVLSTLVEAMLGDPMIREPIKPRIKRLAVPMLKTAFEDASFFSDDAHPARQVVNRLGMMDLPVSRDEGEEGDSLESDVDPLLDAIINDDDAGATSFRSALPALDELLSRQSASFEERLTQVLSSPEHEEAVSSAKSPTVMGGDADAAGWVERVGRLAPGDMVAFGAKSRRPDARTLAWCSDDRSLFVFTDRNGERPSSLSRGELARRMSKGNIALLDSPDMPAMDRGMFNVLNDIHREVAEESQKDSVTGLPGMDQFRDQVDHAIDRAQKVGSKHAMLAMNLDGFASINEEGGRRAGNSLLRKIARLLRGQVGTDGAITRVHADEFLVLLTDHGFMDAKRYAERQCRAIANARVAFKDKEFPISVSIGLVPVTRAANSIDVLMEHARAALASAKRLGGNQVRIYDPDEDVEVFHADDEVELLQPDPAVEDDETVVAPVPPSPPGEAAREKITDKLNNGELVLRRQLVQPIQGEDGKPHFELLLALGTVKDDETRSLPGGMIPDAERENLMPEVDRWVIRTALAWMQRSRREVLRSGGYAINLSGSSLSDPKLLEFVIGALTETAVPPAKVIFEVTESAAIDRLSNAVEFIRTLREYGCRFSIDDFGAGHATFTYLKTLPVDYVKIDGLFVRELVSNPNDRAMVASIHEISHMLGKKTIAEHVESDEALAALKSMGVDYAQGFAIARPELLP